MNNIFICFKTFNKGLINRYGFKYDVNKIYHLEI